MSITEDNNRNTFNPSYIGPRDDILRLIPENVKRVLDIGCSIGALGENIQRERDAEVVGIELDAEMAKIAEQKLNHVVIGDVENIKLENALPYKDFDCIIFADSLEHLKDPWRILKEFEKYLSEEGIIIASIPNIRHYTTILNLLIKGYWPYRLRGIHDKTHLRFFTLKSIKEMFRDSGLKIISLQRKYRIIERPHSFNILSRFFALPPFKDLLTFQYLIVAKKGKISL